MKFTVEHKENYTLVTSDVEKLDAQHAPELKSELVVISKNGVKNMVLDLDKSRYCDSSGLSAILVGNRLCKESGGTFVICNLNEPVSKLISISQLNSVLNITPTVSEAVDMIFMEEVGKDVQGE